MEHQLNNAEACVFCEIVRRSKPASIVVEDERTIAAVDLRQFHPGHILVIPRQHINDVRDLDPETGAAVMATVTRVARAVAHAFPNQGLSLWHSIGEAADQEVPHMHIHIHPRLLGDGLLRIYPSLAPEPERATLEQYAALVKVHLD